MADTYLPILDGVAVVLLGFPDPRGLSVASNHVQVILEQNIAMAPKKLGVSTALLQETGFTTQHLGEVEQHGRDLLLLSTCKQDQANVAVNRNASSRA